MKFGKHLQNQLEETLPEWKDKYLSYKQLKKRIKLIPAPVTTETLAIQICDQKSHDQATILSESQDSSIHESSRSECSDGVVSQCTQLQNGSTVELFAEEADFIHLLNAELDKFNAFFIEKEEEYVIRLQSGLGTRNEAEVLRNGPQQELKDKCEQVKGKSSEVSSNEISLTEETMNMQKEIVNFHGEMVLLEHYSSLNYTGLVKILKKHDKRAGALLCMPFIRNVLQQPFFTTEILSKLVQECERNLQLIFPSPSNLHTDRIPNANSSSSSVTDGSVKMVQTTNINPDKKPLANESFETKVSDHVSDGEDVDSIYRSTMAALRTIKEIRKGSSTTNIFSLPPFKEEDEDSLPVRSPR